MKVQIRDNIASSPTVDASKKVGGMDTEPMSCSQP